MTAEQTEQGRSERVLGTVQVAVSGAAVAVELTAIRRRDTNPAAKRREAKSAGTRLSYVNELQCSPMGVGARGLEGQWLDLHVVRRGGPDAGDERVTSARARVMSGSALFPFKPGCAWLQDFDPSDLEFLLAIG